MHHSIKTTCFQQPINASCLNNKNFVLPLYYKSWLRQFNIVDKFTHNFLCIVPCPLCVPTFPKSCSPKIYAWWTLLQYHTTSSFDWSNHLLQLSMNSPPLPCFNLPMWTPFLSYSTICTRCWSTQTWRSKELATWTSFLSQQFQIFLCTRIVKDKKGWALLSISKH